LLLLHRLLAFCQRAYVREVLPSTVAEAADRTRRGLLRYQRVLLEGRLERAFSMLELGIGEAAIDVDAAWALLCEAQGLTRAWEG
jgi:hypothetical protein